LLLLCISGPRPLIQAHLPICVSALKPDW